MGLSRNDEFTENKNDIFVDGERGQAGLLTDGNFV